MVHIENLNDVPVFYDSYLYLNRLLIKAQKGIYVLWEAETWFHYQHAKQFPPSNSDEYVC